jgi:Gas vesicle protein
VTQSYTPAQHRSPYGASDPRPASLADVLELVLDKGIVIAGDIKINLLEIELLTIKVRLLIASVDKARELGINWWESDPSLSSGDRGNGEVTGERGDRDQLGRRVEELEERLTQLTAAERRQEP